MIICDVGIWKVLRKVTKEWVCSLFGLPPFWEFLFLMSRDTFVFCGDMFMNERRTTEPAEFKRYRIQCAWSNMEQVFIRKFNKFYCV